MCVTTLYLRLPIVLFLEHTSPASEAVSRGGGMHRGSSAGGDTGTALRDTTGDQIARNEQSHGRTMGGEGLGREAGSACSYEFTAS